MADFHEECGVIGVFAKQTGPVAHDAYLGLCALQHRGQDSCGIAVNDQGLFRLHTDTGLASEVMTEGALLALGEGRMAVGHVRYGLDEKAGRMDIQPLVIAHRKALLALANNGSLVNYGSLRDRFEDEGFIFHTTSDAEVISCLITKERLTAPSTEAAISRAMGQLEGSYTLVVMTTKKLIAVRGPMGLRPLCLGVKEDGTYVAASETCALDVLGASFVRDVEPGEIVVITDEGLTSITTHCQTHKQSLCVFEYIYFARPDSVIDGVSVHEARVRAGEFLSKEHPVEADLVVGVPDSGIDGAIGYARASGIPYSLGFIKNTYIGRTFIKSAQNARKAGVHIKLNPLSAVVRGKRIVLVDDSIVRGTTSREIVRLLRKAGATEVHMRITSPPFINPCYYGTDIKSREHLIACKYTTEEIRDLIGADSLGYLSLEGVKGIAKPLPRERLCTACFDGSYPTHPPRVSQREKYAQRLMCVGG